VQSRTLKPAGLIFLTVKLGAPWVVPL